MYHILAAATFFVVMGSLPAAAVSPLPLAKPEIDAVREIMTIEGTGDAMDMTIDASIAEEVEVESAVRPAGLDLEPAAPNLDWNEASQSGVAFPIVDGLSLGVDYEIEETEDLAADGMNPGSASDEHASHNVLIRANIQFDLTK
jgi:hypothetical protein